METLDQAVRNVLAFVKEAVDNQSDDDPDALHQIFYSRRADGGSREGQL